MKISELLNFVDTVKPNAFPASVKVAWLNEVDGMVWTDVMLLSPLEFKKYLYDENTGEGDGELLVNAPHDKLYNVYLAAMIDFYNGEYDKYQNSITMFNSYFNDYMRWYALNYRPADGGFRYMGEYITAYGIAVKHGFEGTEEEWLASLEGDKGDAFTYEDFTPEQLAALKGIPGDDGVGIKDITRTSGNGAPGTTDTYTITFTNDSKTTFDVYNGKDGTNGKDGADGKDYVLTDADRTAIAEEASDMVYAPATPQDYGAVGGDGTTDDTTAFQNALAANRGVFVPGGTYKLSGTLVIRPNCCLELSQDTVLKFTQTSGNCIELRSSATLRGNHGIVYVPYAFAGKAVVLDADFDTETNTQPYDNWDPMWKSGRYVYDVCIVKANSSGLHYSTDGACSGTALYMHADSTKSLRYMWGVTTTGIRIAGAFNYGIHAIDDGTAWNHDMRIEAVIDSCEIGVALENCNCAHLAVTVQPRKAADGTKYAKHGIYLKNSLNVDLIGSRVWDWHNTDPDKLVTLWTDGGVYQHIALYGNCTNLVLDDFLYNNQDEIRDLIYTDKVENFETMTILQEPFTRYFKPKDGKPYFNNGDTEKRLLLKEEFDDCFITDRIPTFTDALATAIDKSGAIYNGTGYKSGVVVSASSGVDSSDPYYWSTGYIACKAGDVIRAEGLSFKTAFAINDGVAKVVMFDSGFNRVWSATAQVLNGGSTYYQEATTTDDTFELTLKPTLVEQGTVAYIRITLAASDVGKRPVIAVNENIGFTQEGFLADGIKVKGNNILVYSPGGQAFKLTINDDGVLTPVKLES